jgi:branched-chain amino acid aminotransferase
MKVYINGTLYDRDDAKVSVFDHGLLYGDGVFEGIRLYNGRIFKCEEHLARLERSARCIMLDMPWSRDEIRNAMVATVRANELRDGYIRLVVTRGAGTLGLNPFRCVEPQLIVIAGSVALYPEELYQHGMGVITVATRRIGEDALSPQVKSLNYLNNIMAKIEALNAGFQEAIMLNSEGVVAECTGDNIFIVRDGALVTPDQDVGALQGITRDTVIALAREMGLATHEQTITRYALYCAEECFLTGTAAEVIPVTAIDGRTIGTGAPGPVTVRLIERYRACARSTGTEVYATEDACVASSAMNARPRSTTLK